MSVGGAGPPNRQGSGALPVCRLCLRIMELCLILRTLEVGVGASSSSSERSCFSWTCILNGVVWARTAAGTCSSPGKGHRGRKVFVDRGWPVGPVVPRRGCAVPPLFRAARVDAPRQAFRRRQSSGTRGDRLSGRGVPGNTAGQQALACSLWGVPYGERNGTRGTGAWERGVAGACTGRPATTVLHARGNSFGGETVVVARERVSPPSGGGPRVAGRSIACHPSRRRQQTAGSPMPVSVYCGA